MASKYDIPALSKTLDISEWNTTYEKLGVKFRLKDMRDAEYEETVLGTLLALCEDDPVIALAVFDHDDNVGGWMSGNVRGKLVAMITARGGTIV